MKILITGSKGFIGTHLKEALKDHEVIECDWEDGVSVKSLTHHDLKGVDVIVHLAALISVEESWKMPGIYFLVNTMETLLLAELAAKCKVKKFIFASSAAVYGNPLSPYGASKLSAEHALDCFKEKMNISILRFYNIYGKGQSEEYAGVIAKFVKNIKSGKAVTIYGNGEQRRDFVYIDDVISIIKKLIDKDIHLISATDIGKGTSHSVNQLVTMLSKIAKKPVKIKYKKSKDEIMFSCSSDLPKSLRRKFTPLEKGLQLLYA